MQQVDVPRAASLAVTAAVLNPVCAAAFVLSPDATTQFFNSWMHGIDLNKLRSATPITVAGVTYGIIVAAAVAFVAGIAFAVIYYAFNRSPRT